MALGLPVVSFAIGGIGEYLYGAAATEAGDELQGAMCSASDSGTCTGSGRGAPGSPFAPSVVMGDRVVPIGNGVIVSEATGEALGAAVLDILSNGTLRDQVAHAARRTVRSTH